MPVRQSFGAPSPERPGDDAQRHYTLVVDRNRQESSDPRSFRFRGVPASRMPGVTKAFGTMQGLPAHYGRYWARKPPSTGSVWPVTIAAAGLAK